MKSLLFVAILMMVLYVFPVSADEGIPISWGEMPTNQIPLPPFSKGEVDETTKSTVLARLFQTPLHFVANEGQFPEEVVYYAKSESATIYCTEQGLVFGFAEGSISLKFSEDRRVKPSARGELEGKVNYFIGNDPALWQTDIPIFAEVVYQGVYPGIDLVYSGNQQRLKYTFYLQPHSEPNQILMTYDGIESLCVDDATGELVIQTPWGEMRDAKPVAYQEIEGVRKKIDISFRLIGEKSVGFVVGNYDPNFMLTLDPGYSTYLGGSNLDWAYGIAVDSSGNAYVTGWTRSSNFPTHNPYDSNLDGSRDVFVTKLSSSGNMLIYSTYLGGSSGDIGYGIAVDSSGNAYVTGYTSSSNFPTQNPFQAYQGDDAFVTKLSSSGNTLIYSTYLGGSDRESGLGIAVDGSGNAYVTGDTYSSNFPTHNAYDSNLGGARDGFVTKLNSNGNMLIYSTYLGGNYSDNGNGIAVDNDSGNAYVTGRTSSSNFPTLSPYQGSLAEGSDAFVTRLSSNGNTLIYSTYLGGNNSDEGYSIAVDSSGNAYVTGYTESTDFPTQNPYQGTHANAGYNDVFVTKLSSSGNTLIYSTYLGGSALDEGHGIALDGSGNAYVTGYTRSTNFPTLNQYQGYQGATDAFVAKLSSSGDTLIYSTYLGGSNGDEGHGIAVDSSGNAYVTGRTYSSDFPTENPFQDGFGGGYYDAFVASFSDIIPPTPNTIASIVAVSASRIDLTSTEATDVTPPISYRLDGQYYDGAAWVDDGGGVSDYDYSQTRPNPWSDTNLVENGLYRYRQRVKDSATPPNESAWSDWVEKATLLNPPQDAEITFANVTTTGMYVTVATPPQPSGIGSTGAYFDLITGEGEGSGAIDRDWADDYTAEYTNLTPNTQYGWKVKYRNRDGVETAYNPTEQKRYTLANTPLAPTVSNSTPSTLDVTINPNGNPDHTLFAVYNVTDGCYIDASGVNNGDTEVWQTKSDWGIVPVVNLTPGTTYEFKCKAQNGDSIETSLGPSGFGTTAPPLAPIINLLNPISGVVGAMVTISGSNFGEEQGDSTVTFNGVDAGTADNWTDTEIIIKAPAGATTGNVMVTVNGQASNSDKVFTVIQPPVLIPYEPDPTNDTTPSLDWQDVPGVSAYHIQIDDNAEFSSPIVDLSSLQDSGYTPASDLPEGVIYWRVGSVDAAGNESEYSDADSFTIDITPPAVPTLVEYTPDPTNNNTPTLDWNDVEGAATYHVQIDNDKDLGSPIVESWLTSSAYTPTSALPEGVIYWRVRSKDAAGNESEYSDADSFTIDVTPPAPNTIALIVAVSANQIDLTSTEAEDSTPPVSYHLGGQYYDGSSWVDSNGGVSDCDYSTTRPNPWSDTNIVENGLYRYRQQVKDSATSPNESGWSDWVEKATWLNPPQDAEITFANITETGMDVKVATPPKPSGAGETGAYFDLITGQGQGSGATDRGYADDYTAEYTDLTPNTQYGWKVKYRNRDGVETAYTPTEQKRYTLANKPSAPTVNNPTSTTLDVTINPNGNPPHTLFAIYNVTGSYYVNSTGGSNGATEVWQTKSAWGTVTVVDLTPGTTYHFQCKAKNGDGIETPLGASGSETTPSITLASPNAGEVWRGGSSHDITWNTSGPGIDHIRLLYSTDSGNTYPNTIVASTENDGTHTWTVPTLDSSTVRVKAIAEDANNNSLADDESAADFTIDSTAPETTATLSGTEGENGWYISDVTVELSATDNLSDVKETNYKINDGAWETYSSPFTISGTTIYYKSEDNAGNVEAEKSKEIKVDKTAPETPVVTDDGDCTTNGSQLHASWISSDDKSGISEYQYAIGTTAGGTDIISWTSVGTDTFVTATGLSLTDGQMYYFSVKAKSGAGLWSSVGVSDGIIVNLTPPVEVKVLDLTAPPGETIIVPISVSDVTELDLIAVELTLTYNPNILTARRVILESTFTEGWTSLANITNGQTVIWMASTTAPSGSGTLVSIEFQVSPNAQNGQTSPLDLSKVRFNEGRITATTVDGVFTVDNIPPETTISLSGAQEDNDWYISDVTVTLPATDTGSGVKETKYKIGSGSWKLYPPAFTISDEGTTTVYYYSEDNAGNIESEKSLEIKIDRTAPDVPTLIAYTPDPTNDTTPTLDWNDVTGASTYHIQIDDNSDFSSPIIDDSTLTASSYTPENPLPEGVIYWRVKSKDAAGNESEYSDADSFTIDVTPPAPNIIASIVAVSASQIELTSTEATDDTPPVSYHLDGQYYDGAAWVDDGGGVSDYDYSQTRPNPWSDTNLVEDGRYRYRQQVKDSANPENESVWSDWVEKYTLANTPSAPTVSNPTSTTLDVTINPNGNPDHTLFAIYNVTGNYYVDANGGSNGDTEVWQTKSDWGTVTVVVLTQGTTYAFKCKAKNGDGVGTDLGAPGSGTTLTVDSVDPTISDVRKSNYQNSEVSITWWTDIQADTKVHYGTTTNLGQTAIGNDNATLHRVTLTGLTAETLYYFSVQSGNTTDDNQGSFYQFTTTKIPSGINPFHTVYGFVYKDDAKTQPAVGALVFLTVTNETGTSYPLSTITGGNGDWALDLTSLKNPTTNDNFSYTAGDAIHVEAYDGTNDTSGDATVSAGGATQFPDMILTSIQEPTLSLKAGLNSIGFPLQMTESYTSKSWLPTVTGATKIYNLRPGGGFEFAFKIPGTEIITGTDFDILADRGYIVQVEQDSDYIVRGYPYSTPLTLDLKAGLNAIAIPYSSTAYTSKSLIPAITSAVKVYNLRPGGGFEFAFKIPGTSIITGTDFDILADRGYIVQVEQDTSFPPGGVIPAPPAIAIIHSRGGENMPERIQTSPKVSDIHAYSATISWLGAMQSLRYGTSPHQLDKVVRDDGVSHLVQLEGLQPGMTYFYAVGNQTGNFQTLSEERLMFDFHTLAGEVQLPDGSPAPDGTLVYVQVGESRLVSRTISGIWSVDLVNLPSNWQVGQKAVIEAYGTGHGKVKVLLSSSDIQWVLPIRLKSVDDSAPARGAGKFALLRNYPNPFNPETWIPFELANDSFVALRIYDVQGRLVRSLDLGHRAAGRYYSQEQAAHWDGRNETGEFVATGLYFYTLQASKYTATRRMLLLK